MGCGQAQSQAPGLSALVARTGWGVGPDTVATLAVALFETPSSRNRRLSSSLPSSRDTLNEPFGQPSFLPEALALTGLSGSETRSPSTSANTETTRAPVASTCVRAFHSAPAPSPSTLLAARSNCSASTWSDSSGISTALSSSPSGRWVPSGHGSTIADVRDEAEAGAAGCGIAPAAVARLPRQEWKRCARRRSPPAPVPPAGRKYPRAHAPRHTWQSSADSPSLFANQPARQPLHSTRSCQRFKWRRGQASSVESNAISWRRLARDMEESSVVPGRTRNENELSHEQPNEWHESLVEATNYVMRKSKLSLSLLQTCASIH